MLGCCHRHLTRKLSGFYTNHLLVHACPYFVFPLKTKLSRQSRSQLCRKCPCFSAVYVAKPGRTRDLGVHLHARSSVGVSFPRCTGNRHPNIYFPSATPKLNRWCFLYILYIYFNGRTARARGAKTVVSLF
jgi:hypothetical protein